jgi:hypothetical protein
MVSFLSLTYHLARSTFSGRGSGAGFAMGSYDQPVLVNVRRTGSRNHFRHDALLPS